MLEAFLWGALAAVPLLIGYLLAERGLSNRIIGLIMGFGAGALISAIAYELVPESMNGGWEVALFLLIGSVTFFLADWFVDRWGGGKRKTIAGEHPGGSGAAVYIGTLLDGVPEAIVLGMGLATGGSIQVAFLVAVFVSNLPEGMAGTLNLSAAGHSRRQIFWMWVSLVFVSAVQRSSRSTLPRPDPPKSTADGQYGAASSPARRSPMADLLAPTAISCRSFEAYERGRQVRHGIGDHLVLLGLTVFNAVLGRTRNRRPSQSRALERCSRASPGSVATDR